MKTLICSLFLSLSLMGEVEAYIVPSDSVNLANIETNYAVRDKIIELSSNYIGIRYRYGGNTPSGFDCSGFTKYVFEQFGMELPSASWLQSKDGLRVPLESVQAGDLLFFGKRNKVSHVGIVVSRTDGQLLMIHSSSSRGIIIEDVYTSSYWKNRLLYARDVISDNIFAKDQDQILTF